MYIVFIIFFCYSIYFYESKNIIITQKCFLFSIVNYYKLLYLCFFKKKIIKKKAKIYKNNFS